MKYENYGDYTLTDLKLTSYDGVTVDVANIFHTINVYEDIFAGFISGDITLIDAHNLLSNLPVIGHEKLRLIFSTAGKEDNPIDIEMSIYKITDRKQVGTGSLQYTLHFISNEAIINEQVSISKSMRGSIDGMVDAIMVYLNTDKELLKDRISGNDQVVIPHWSPLKTLNWLMTRVKSDLSGAGYLFYETVRGFRVTDIAQSVVKDAARTFNYGFTAFDKDDPDELERSFSKVEAYEIININDTLQNMDVGTYSNKFIEYDIHTKEISTRTIDSIRDFKTLESTPILPPNYTVSPDSEIGFYHTNSGRYPGYHDNREQGQRLSQLGLLMGTTVRIMASGDSDLQLASVVNFDIPSPENSDKPQYEKMLSGRFLVSRVRHKITRDKYHSVLELSKDSYSGKL